MKAAGLSHVYIRYIPYRVSCLINCVNSFFHFLFFNDFALILKK